MDGCGFATDDLEIVGSVAILQIHASAAHPPVLPLLAAAANTQCRTPRKDRPRAGAYPENIRRGGGIFQ